MRKSKYPHVSSRRNLLKVLPKYFPYLGKQILTPKSKTSHSIPLLFYHHYYVVPLRIMESPIIPDTTVPSGRYLRVSCGWNLVNAIPRYFPCREYKSLDWNHGHLMQFLQPLHNDRKVPLRTTDYRWYWISPPPTCFQSNSMKLLSGRYCWRYP